jgi:hypothetical protein
LKRRHFRRGQRRCRLFDSVGNHNPVSKARLKEGGHLLKGDLVAKENRGSRVASQLRLSQGVRRGLLALGAAVVIGSAAARGEDLDQGKSAARLFADSCASCHRSARGLAKGRFSLTLYMFLRDHYVSGSTSAWALTSYLESVNGGQPGRSRAAAAKASSPATWAARSSPRPPAPVPR